MVARLVGDVQISVAQRHVISLCFGASHLVSLLELLHELGTPLLYLVVDSAQQKVFSLLMARGERSRCDRLHLRVPNRSQLFYIGQDLVCGASRVT